MISVSLKNGRLVKGLQLLNDLTIFILKETLTVVKLRNGHQEKELQWLRDLII